MPPDHSRIRTAVEAYLERHATGATPPTRR